MKERCWLGGRVGLVQETLGEHHHGRKLMGLFFCAELLRRGLSHQQGPRCTARTAPLSQMTEHARPTMRSKNVRLHWFLLGAVLYMLEICTKISQHEGLLYYAHVGGFLLGLNHSLAPSMF